jgi:hypothetical protein
MFTFLLEMQHIEEAEGKVDAVELSKHEHGQHGGKDRKECETER